MTKKAEFTTQEWETLRDAPHLVMLSVATAGASGLFGSIKEAIAPAGAIIEAAKSNNELMRSICEREEIKAAQKAVRASIKSSSKLETLREELQTQAADCAREACEILRNKGAAEDLNEFRSLLVNIADRTAEAASEGGFFGFGGERVSEGERTAINRISQALEIHAT